ncbi:MAG: hypothetical protein COV10_03160 [Candidatus Vogelbacteria bacterium CG10_big_fil_rev_8_21_14_0_10_51_16]|uniref:TGS domain-containing protein n=1 Tax=Candidatus Vogelbacteria bacterium CG10_big_fil_rev_8_21_14_0_10_51_16 TaxID=1975045 RepID=A0A2H0RDU7_9BACT|nr:MAG: hypothetical protein COV10_03160 [Candidatus Vogelbacteria bacterium CG10_big_fil_rev_8_21_14_0_10_51_16]
MSSEFQKIIEAMKSKDKLDVALVTKAYQYAEETHKDQKRLSGEPYLAHEVATAIQLAELSMDAEAIAAGLLHDAIDDGGIEPKALEAAFGPNTLFMVESVSRLSRLKYRGDEQERHAENLRKLFVAMAKDIRVLIVKLACRLHNVQTLQFVSKEKQERQALETLDIYARLADRLGMGKLKEELEDGAFPFAYPDEYRLTMDVIQSERTSSEVRLEKLSGLLSEKLSEQNIAHELEYRLKGAFSTFRKLVEKEWQLERINDLSALRVIVADVSECYRVLGVIHSLWTPLADTFKDYVATPKPNGYRSLHTVIFTGDGGKAEIQIRSREMHRDAEYGITAHVAYAEAGKPKEGARMVGRSLQWVRQLLDWQQQFAESASSEFLQNLKADFFEHRIFVFTPKGDVIELPEGATPVDFAYAVHTDVGDRTTGAYRNGKYVALSTELTSGDVVEIATKKSGKPTEKWLTFVKTSLAKRRIRQTVEQKRLLKS